MSSLYKLFNMDRYTRLRYDLRMENAEHFGAVLAEHRRNAGLSQSRLARVSGLSRGTIANIEAGRTLPAKDTQQRLLKVKQLALPTGQSEETPTATPTSWITRLYSPLDMSREMERLLNGPGGTLEQTYSYVDPQSARDWYDYANLPEYVAKFRNQFPAKELASATLGRENHRAIDLVALGVGDGICETELARQLAVKMGKEPDLRCYLLDISHPLLVEAFKHAAGELKGVAPVFPIHGNFHDLRSVIALAVRTEERRRLWCMIGNTFGNLDHEPRFLTDLTACTRSGDLLLLDLQLTWADADDRTAILAADPIFQKKLPEPLVHWLSGPLHRHCRGARHIKLDVELSLRCPLPGSYQVTIWATVEQASGGIARHQIFLNRRHTLPLLAAELRDMGWRTVRQFTYGPDEPQHRGGLLLERV